MRTEDLISLLHEVGHAVDFKERSVGIARQERNAWAEALKIARRYNMPITSLIREHAQFFMESYNQDMGVSATNKSRKQRKNK